MFFLLWIIILAIIYGMLGNTIDKDDDHEHDGHEYEEINRFIKLFIYSYRNSVGDVKVPDNEYWQLFKDDKGN